MPDGGKESRLTPLRFWKRRCEFAIHFPALMPDAVTKGDYEQTEQRKGERRGGGRRRGKCAGELHPHHHRRGSEVRQTLCHRYPVSAGTERLSPHRPCQVHLPQLRPGARLRRPLPPPLRRHQSGQGRGGVHRIHQGERPLARVRLGENQFYASDYFEQLYHVGGATDREGEGLCGRPHRRRDPGIPRYPDRAGQGKPVPEPDRGGEPGPVPPHAGRRVPGRLPGAPGQDRHGLAQHEPARSGHVPHPSCDPPPYRRRLVHLSHVRLCPRPVRLHRGNHPFHLHPGVRGPPPPLRLVPGQPWRSIDRGRSNLPVSTSPTR